MFSIRRPPLATDSRASCFALGRYIHGGGVMDGGVFARSRVTALQREHSVLIQVYWRSE